MRSSSLLWRKIVALLCPLFEEGGKDDEHLVSFVPLALGTEGIDNIVLSLISLEQLQYNLVECFLLTLQLLEESDALFGRILVVILLDSDEATTNTDHTIFASHRHLLGLASDQVLVLGLQLGNGHEDAQQLHKRLHLDLTEVLDVEVFVLSLLSELRVEHILSLLHLALELFDNLRDSLLLLSLFVEELNLETWEPLDALENLLNGHGLLE